MKINKIFLFAAMAFIGAGFTSCGDDDDFEPGKPAGSNDVYFVDQQNLAIGLTDNSFTISVGRAKSASAQSVPLKQILVDDVFTVPATVDFAAGDTLTEVTIQMSDAASPFVDYRLRLAIPEEYTSPYAQHEEVPELSILVHKEDYKPYAAIEYTSWFFEDTWDDLLEYSEMLEQYRMAPIAEGAYIFFKIASDGTITVTDDTGKVFTGAKFSGYTHPSYGPVNMTWAASAFTGYDDESDAYYIPFTWRVSAGSFGTGYESFKIKSKY